MTDDTSQAWHLYKRVPIAIIVSPISNIKSPREGLAKPQMRRFIAEANDDDRAAMDKAKQHD